MSSTVKYSNNTITTLNNGTKILTTGGKWVENDIVITDESIDGVTGGYVYQDEAGYVALDDDQNDEIEIKNAEFTMLGEYEASENMAFNPVAVNVTGRDASFLDRTITEVLTEDLDGITTIGTYAFRYCENLESVEFAPSVTEIKYGAFEYCSGLKEITFPPTLTTIRDYAFSRTGIEHLVIPETVTHMSEATFYYCDSLKTLEIYGQKTFSSAINSSYGARNMFWHCTALESVKIINCYFTGGGSEFSQCTSLVDVYCPKGNLVTAGTFSGCTALKRLALPGNTACYSNTFKDCSSLEAIDFDKRTQFFRATIFNNCSALETIVLRGDTLTTLTYTNVFDGTPFAEGGTGGTIYIPKALYDELGTGSSLDYKAATNWATFDGYGTITWAKIEGSPYEYYYVDGRGVLQIVTDNLTNCSLSNDIAHYHTEFEATIIPDDGYTINSVSITMNNVDITNSVYDSSSHTVTISSPDGEIVITASAI